MTDIITVIDKSEFIPFEDQIGRIQDGNKAHVTLKNGKIHTLIFESNNQAYEYVSQNLQIK